MLLSGITTLGKTTLVIAAALFITWAIVTAILVPRRNPQFPRRLDAYILVSAIFFIAQMSAIVWVSETQEVEEAHAAEGPAGGGHGEEAGGGEEGGTPTTPEAPAAGDAAAGKEVFASAGCEACHTLADAGSTGMVGPNLDEAKPPAELVVERVTNGMGAMPPFKGQLTDKQIQDVAAYVSSVAGSS